MRIRSVVTKYALIKLDIDYLSVVWGGWADDTKLKSVQLEAARVIIGLPFIITKREGLDADKEEKYRIK